METTTDLELRTLAGLIKNAQLFADIHFPKQYHIKIEKLLDLHKSDFKAFSEIIIDKSCHYFELDINGFKGKSRRRIYCDARTMYCNYLLETYRKAIVLTSLGKTINRDHATVIHYLKVHDNLIQTCQDYKARYLRYSEFLDQQTLTSI